MMDPADFDWGVTAEELAARFGDEEESHVAALARVTPSLSLSS